MNQFNVWAPEVLELFLNPKINLMKSTMQWNGFDYPVGKRPRKKLCGKSNAWQNWTKEISSDITAHGSNTHPKVIYYKKKNYNLYPKNPQAVKVVNWTMFPELKMFFKWRGIQCWLPKTQKLQTIENFLVLISIDISMKYIRLYAIMF